MYQKKKKKNTPFHETIYCFHRNQINWLKKMYLRKYLKGEYLFIWLKLAISVFASQKALENGQRL